MRPVVDEDGRGERIKVWRCVFLNARHDHQSSSKTIGVQVTQQVTTRQGIGIQTDERGSNDVVHTPLFHQSSTGENPITSWQVHSKRRLSPQLDTGHGAKRHKAFNTTSKGNSEGRGSRVIAAKQQLPAKFGHLRLADINKHWPAKARMRHTLWFYVQETVLAGQYAEPDHTALELFNREWEALRARYEGRWESLSSSDPATLPWDVESGSSDATQDYEYAAGRHSGNTKSGGARQKASDRSNTPAKVRRSSTSAQTGASQLPAYTPSSPIRIGNVRATESVSQTRVSRQLHSVTPAPAGPQMGTFYRSAKPEVARARAQLAQRINASTSTANELRRSPQAASRVPARAAPRPGTEAGMPLPSAGLFPLSAAGATFGAQQQPQISQIQLPPGYALIQSSDADRPPFWPIPVQVVPPGQAQHRPPAVLHQGPA